MYEDITVRYVYVDFTVLIWQKGNEAFPSQHLPVKS